MWWTQPTDSYRQQHVRLLVRQSIELPESQKSNVICRGQLFNKIGIFVLKSKYISSSGTTFSKMVALLLIVMFFLLIISLFLYLIEF